MEYRQYDQGSQPMDMTSIIQAEVTKCVGNMSGQAGFTPKPCMKEKEMEDSMKDTMPLVLFLVWIEHYG